MELPKELDISLLTNAIILKESGVCTKKDEFTHKAEWMNFYYCHRNKSEVNYLKEKKYSAAKSWSWPIRKKWSQPEEEKQMYTSYSYLKWSSAFTKRQKGYMVNL